MPQTDIVVFHSNKVEHGEKCPSSYILRHVLWWILQQWAFSLGLLTTAQQEQVVWWKYGCGINSQSDLKHAFDLKRFNCCFTKFFPLPFFFFPFQDLGPNAWGAREPQNWGGLMGWVSERFQCWQQNRLGGFGPAPDTTLPQEPQLSHLWKNPTFRSSFSPLNRAAHLTGLSNYITPTLSYLVFHHTSVTVEFFSSQPQAPKEVRG